MPLTENDIHFEEVDQGAPVVQLLNRHRIGKRGMFIVHMDRTSLKDKRDAFLMLLAISVTLTGVFIWRLIVGKGKYLPLLLPDNMGLVDRPTARASSSFSEFFWTCMNIAFDSVLAISGKILLLPFLTGPLYSRLRFGFRSAEPAFRVPTQSVTVERLAKLDPESRAQEMRKEILKAVNRKHVETCQADFMGLGIWAVDYAPARDASAMLARKEVTEEDLELSVWELDGEMKWRVWRVPMVYRVGPYSIIIPSDLDVSYKSSRETVNPR